MTCIVIWKNGLWSDKQNRLLSDAAQNARRLIRAWTYVACEHMQKALVSLSAQLKTNL